MAGDYVLTETQKKFRKEMKELQKQNKKTGSDEIYSYVHRGFVGSKRWSTNKKTIINFGGIVAFIWTAYCLYTWVAPLLPVEARQAIQNTPILSMFQSSQQKVVKDINFCEPYIKLANDANGALSKGVEQTKVSASGMIFLDNSHNKTIEI
ncbi:MAG: hypothetical protein H7Y41_05470, partial [Hyphomonadaceae bacterium]|nr:hypothetical protein [Clostridia bacterium]